MASRKVASHNDYVKLEALVESGLSVYQSAKQIGLPLGAFKSANGDREWFEQIKAKEETCRASAVDELIDRRVQSGEAGDALTKAWATRNHPEYGDKTQIEVTGRVEHEHRGEFALGHLIAVAREAGVLEQLDHRLEAALPAASEVPARPGGAAKRPAGDLPAAR
jgi:hypothetical protein